MRQLLALLMCVPACGGDDAGGTAVPDDLDVIASTPASGTIMGVPFTLGTRFMNVSDGELFVDLLSTVAADCTVDETDEQYPFIIFSTSPTPGTTTLGFDTGTVTFVDKPSNNLIVTSGVITIDAVTADRVMGGLHVWDAEFGEINGRFDGELCYTN